MLISIISLGVDIVGFNTFVDVIVDVDVHVYERVLGERRSLLEPLPSFYEIFASRHSQSLD